MQTKINGIRLAISSSIPINKHGEADMDSDAFLDQEYENLNDAILQAIVASTEVQDILARFKKLNQIDDKAVLNLFLSLDELYQIIHEESSAPATYKLEPRSASEKPVKQEESFSKKEISLVDGEALTNNEVLFEKFFQVNFNENNWMKKARVRF
jgi:hypothetical protein